MKLKTLDLNRETLRVLNSNEQDNVAGGALTARCQPRCSADTASRVTTRVIYCC
jgi:hypothetical protein